MIYLDHNATTPLDPRVLEAMLPLLGADFANPASKHPAGRAVAERVERAREEAAALVGVGRRDVVFTSGATEAANLAVRGVLACAEPGRRRVLIGATEHKAVSAAAEAVAAADGIGGAGGAKIQTIRVHPGGTVDLGHLRRLLGPDVALVAVMAANNETGVINDVRQAAAMAHRFGALFFCDVTQAAGRIPVALDDWRVDLAVWSAHKLYGPKGVGALSAARHVRRRLPALIAGGGQEHGLRGGTVNTAGVVGFGRACALAAAEMAADGDRERRLVRLLHRSLAEGLGGAAVELNGAGAPRLPNTVNLRFPGAEADAVLACLPDVMVSSGAACSSGVDEPSHVLLAMGLTAQAARESLRFGLGRFTTEEEVTTAASRVADAVARVRSLTSH